MIRDYSEHVGDWAYVTNSLGWPMGFYGDDSVFLGDLARLKNESVWVDGLSPSAMLDNSILAEFKDRDSLLGLTE